MCIDVPMLLCTQQGHQQRKDAAMLQQAAQRHQMQAHAPVCSLDDAFPLQSPHRDAGDDHIAQAPQQPPHCGEVVTDRRSGLADVNKRPATNVCAHRSANVGVGGQIPLQQADFRRLRRELQHESYRQA